MWSILRPVSGICKLPKLWSLRARRTRPQTACASCFPRGTQSSCCLVHASESRKARRHDDTATPVATNLKQHPACSWSFIVSALPLLKFTATHQQTRQSRRPRPTNNIEVHSLEIQVHKEHLLWGLNYVNNARFGPFRSPGIESCWYSGPFLWAP